MVQVYLQENLKVQGQSKRQLKENDNEDEEEEDEDENFAKAEKTQKNDNLDFFAKLMKSRVEDSCKVIITLFAQLSQQYQVMLF